MVKIVNGEIVADDDPRAKHLSSGGSTSSFSQARPRVATSGQFFGGGSGTDNVNSSGSNSFQQFSASGSNNAARGGGSGAQGPPGGGGGGNRNQLEADNLISRDLANLLGIYGRRVNILGVDMLLVYAVLLGVALCLYLIDQTEILRLAMFAFLGYFLYKSFTPNTTGQNIGGGNMSGQGGGGGGDGSSPFAGNDLRAGGGQYRPPGR
ncbi:unnamed protein product [Amoebophrya sp. A25]|nr:unnamed protein product [Amoebophrya sp. A25]|eukprot:GSA25T00001867001.1